MPVPIPLTFRPGWYLRIQLVSTFLPGALVLLELWLIWEAPHVLRRADEIESSVSGWVVLAAFVVFVFSSFIIGVFVRTLAWAVFRLFFEPRWLERSGAPSEVKKEFEDAFGADAVDRALERHRPFKSAVDGEFRGEAHAYAKLWLREKRPTLNVDQHEYEINFLLGCTGPLLLAPLAFVRLVGRDWEIRWLILAGVIGWVVSLLAMLRAARRQSAEFPDAFRNLLLAEFFGA